MEARQPRTIDLMLHEQIALVFLGALAGGLVNGLTGFGTGITALGLWLYVISPTVAASLVVICSIVAQIQMLPMIWRTIDRRRVSVFIVPGLIGVPLGTWALPQVDGASFRIGVGLFLILYPLFVVLRAGQRTGTDAGGRVADAAIGFGGGVLGGLAGLSGLFNVLWSDIRGWAKDERRSVIQTFNITILLVALATHALSGLLTRDVGLATLAALPGTIGGAWAGGQIYRRLGDLGYQRVILALLFVAGVVMIWTSLG
jgi:uncharacterized membrane protein YfcA